MARQTKPNVQSQQNISKLFPNMVFWTIKGYILNSYNGQLLIFECDGFLLYGKMFTFKGSKEQKKWIKLSLPIWDEMNKLTFDFYRKFANLLAIKQ